jgi:hypothetical protein
MTPSRSGRAPQTILLIPALVLLLLRALNAADFSVTCPTQHFGACDGSDGVAIGQGYFVSATDENNTLRLYSTDPDSKATKLDVPLSSWAKAPPKKKHPGEFHECDLEGAAQIGRRIYWIGSHARNKDGELCPEREVLFATDISNSAEKTKLTLVGKEPYRTLIADILAASTLAEIHSAISAARGQAAPDRNKMPTKEGALNIEALCADGKALLIGFRNPIPGGKALLVPLLNPDAVLENRKPATFGKPILLDLGGLGLRDMVRWRNNFLIIAGDYRDGSDPNAQPSKLFQWEGEGKTPIALNVKLEGLNPEGAVVFGDGNDAKLLLLSDDGTRLINGVKMKDLEESKQFFRSVWLEDVRK